MKKACALLSAAVLAGGLSTAALAHDEGRAGGEPLMKGTISSIDHDSGKIELKTDQGPAQVYFAPDAVKNLKEGDRIALGLETSKKEAKEMHHMSKKTTSSTSTYKEP
jgi:hypothetical protein